MRVKWSNTGEKYHLGWAAKRNFWIWESFSLQFANELHTLKSLSSKTQLLNIPKSKKVYSFTQKHLKLNNSIGSYHKLTQLHTRISKNPKTSKAKISHSRAQINHLSTKIFTALTTQNFQGLNLSRQKHKTCRMDQILYWVDLKYEKTWTKLKFIRRGVSSNLRSRRRVLRVCQEGEAGFRWWPEIQLLRGFSFDSKGITRVWREES